MIPHIFRSNPTEDFILTISDGDEESIICEEDIVAKDLTLNIKNTKKRKRDPAGIKYHLAQKSSKAAKRSKPSKTGQLELNDGTSLRNEDQIWTTNGEGDGAMDSDFEFMVNDVENGVTEDLDPLKLDGSSSVRAVQNGMRGVDIDELIARRRKSKVDDYEDGRNEDSSSGIEDVLIEEGDDETMAEDGFGMGVTSGDESDKTEGIENLEKDYSDSDGGSVAEPVAHPDDDISESHSANGSDNPEQMARLEAFFAPEEKKSNSKPETAISESFQGMSLSRPILRGLASIGFSEPTPIQRKTIPVALLGKDIVGGAVTGSGKTAAFVIPILERLLYRPRKIPTSRVAILMPTRELAVQCYQVASKLAGFTDITFCQMVGGFSLREQEKVLKSRPDVIIATPGRFIDHMRNSASFTVDTLEILVLDEADRMLEDGFADELNEILVTIPKSRQTMLFSATMTDQVDQLIRAGLNQPVRLMVDAKKQTVGTLVQEFVRIRPGRESKRIGYLLFLCENVFTSKVIIFFRQKKEAHRVRIIFGLCGLKATELHGNMTQEQVWHFLMFILS